MTVFLVAVMMILALAGLRILRDLLPTSKVQFGHVTLLGKLPPEPWPKYTECTEGNQWPECCPVYDYGWCSQLNLHCYQCCICGQTRNTKKRR